MAPNLAVSQHDLIRYMISAGTLTTAQMTAVAGCSERSVKLIRSNLRHFNSTKAFRSAPEQCFDSFLEWCIDVVGGKQNSARGHFRHAGITVEQF
jgi:hypothetical protein